MNEILSKFFSYKWNSYSPKVAEGPIFEGTLSLSSMKLLTYKFIEEIPSTSLSPLLGSTLLLYYEGEFLISKRDNLTVVNGETEHISLMWELFFSWPSGFCSSRDHFSEQVYLSPIGFGFCHRHIILYY